MKSIIQFAQVFLALLILALFVYVIIGFLNLDHASEKEIVFNGRTNLNKNEQKMPNIRKPAVAGSFYPSNRDQLSSLINGYFSKVRGDKKTMDENLVPKIFIVPHAGYEYSGETASYAYKELKEYYRNSGKKEPVLVLIIGSSHQYPLSGFVLDEGKRWDTPLGEIQVDDAFLKNLEHSLRSEIKITSDSEPFANEHSLEVQLPFLQSSLSNFRIAPILIGEAKDEELEKFADYIANYSKENKIIIISSSDLSHYPDYESAINYDNKVIDSILSGKFKNFDETLRELEKEKSQEVVTFACAKQAIKQALLIAEKMGIDLSKKLKYANSFDSTGDKSKVVGYSAIAFYSLNKEKKETSRLNSKLNLSKVEQAKLLEIARTSVEKIVKNESKPNYKDDKIVLESKALQASRGAFVTLKSNNNLRGCIGLLDSNLPLYETVSQMAMAAAVEDSRFMPVNQDELNAIKYEISILSPRKRIGDLNEFEIKKHGIEVIKGNKSGVFLPQVAEEMGCGKERLLEELCQNKAGLPANCWQDRETEIYIFEAEVISQD